MSKYFRLTRLFISPNRVPSNLLSAEIIVKVNSFAKCLHEYWKLKRRLTVMIRTYLNLYLSQKLFQIDHLGFRPKSCCHLLRIKTFINTTFFCEIDMDCEYETEILSRKLTQGKNLELFNFVC